MRKSSPKMPLRFKLQFSPLCQSLSKTLDMSDKTIFTSSKILPKDFKNSRVIDNICLIQKSPGLRLSWLFKDNFIRRFYK